MKLRAGAAVLIVDEWSWEHAVLTVDYWSWEHAVFTKDDGN